MKKLIFAIICLCILISLSSADATIYIEKSGANLDVGESERGAEDNYFNFDSGNNLVNAQFHRDSSWNAWYYPLGVTFDDNDDFFARINFTSTSDWSAYTKTGGAGSANIYVYFGFFNSTQVYYSTHSLSFEVYDYFSGMSIESVIYDNAGTRRGSGFNTSNTIATSTNCYLTLSYDSSSRNLTVNLYEGGSNTGTYVSNIPGGNSFEIDSVGMWAIVPGDGNYAYLNESINVTGFKTNSGTTEEIGGGSSVPEFSDIGWILATVLGISGFILVRKRKIVC